MEKQSNNRRMVIHCESSSRAMEAFVNAEGIKQDDILQFGVSKNGDYMLVYFVNED